ncbi:reductive dehalogenase [Dehalococcoides mccartyi]|uniref:Reductive dehalogenase n=3 Tax=Dehalococcoides TaxID=61434 RepID=A0AB33HRQ4_9CHLR|nr:reductive dehalogenase [Dehalococcoides mccartyi]
MKGLGLAGAGLGVAASASPVFHDMDEVMSSGASRKLPWYINEREAENLTVEVDWDKKERYDKRKFTVVSPAEAERRVQIQLDNIKAKWTTPNTGMTAKDYAFFAGSASDAIGAGVPLTKGDATLMYTFGGTTQPGGYNYKQLGLPRWSGTPEENLKMVTAVLRFWGAHDVGAHEINEKTQKVFYSADPAGRPYTFADVDNASSDSNHACLIPNKAKTVLTWVVPMSRVGQYSAPDGFNILNKVSMGIGYSMGDIIQNRILSFLGALGYLSISRNCGGMNVAHGNLAGLGEHGRTDYLINVDYGANVRYTDFVVTDLPIDDSLFQTFKNPFTFPFGLDASGNAFLSPAFADAAGLVTPDDYGIPRWQGTPEENAAMYRTAVRICGGRETHFLPLDEKTIKLVSAAKGGKPIVFEDVDLPYTDATKCVIPNKCKYAAITMVGQEPVTTKNHAPDFGGTFGAHQAYSMAAKIEFMLRAFMRGIGYLDVFGATEINVPWGIVSGLSELSRMKSGMNPKVGSLFRKCVIGLTDMEFPVSKPIDAGMHRFCYDCGKCAEMCPAQAIVKRDVLREPTWEITSPDNPTGNPTNLKPELFNRPGKRVWPFNHFACHNLWVETASDGCGRCQGLCVFNNFHLSSIHPLVKTTVSVTPLLNSFFYNADRLFGYGELPESSREDFWLKPDKYLPITGFKNY